MPTKELFVYVLGKDISLIAAIIDLVDNSVDGARRLRKPKTSLSDTKSFDGLWIRITANKKEFRIEDNCGGIPLDTAVEYAFRFGRPRAVKGKKHGIPKYATGQFGVGMKRALFKLGNRFTVRSATKQTRFSMDVDVKKWLALPEDDWHFDVDDAERDVKVPEAEIGTEVAVKPLHAEIADDLSDMELLSELEAELANRHSLSLHRGLVIELNEEEIEFEPPRVVNTEEIAPAYRRFSMNGGKPIQVEILCGVSTGTARDSGWSVFLNDRMVLLNNKQEITGWGNKDGERVPRWHGQYGRFRGYAFLTCADTSRLPWDTTKTSLDVDQAVYRKIETEMIGLMEPVVRFLDHVDEENTYVRNGGDPGPLLEALETDESSLFAVLEALDDKKGKPITRPFKRPARVAVKERVPTDQSIQFSRPKDEIEILKDFFDVRSGKAAGEHAWDFVFEAEDL